MGLKESVGHAFVFAALSLAGCEKPVPEAPSFEVDVKPIFEGYCVRCHGAGGTLNIDPRTAVNDTPSSWLGQYEDKVDCTPDAAGVIPGSCVPGARFEAVNGNMKFFLQPGPLRMPLAPADPLSSWELDVVNNWLAEKPTPMP
jgi:hypothetical protein